MAISANYPAPVYVNGYACMNCAQVAEAKKGVNPADVQPGAPPGATGAATATVGGQQSPAIIFGGSLAAGASIAPPSPGPSSSNSQAASPSFATASGPGGLLSISA